MNQNFHLPDNQMLVQDLLNTELKSLIKILIGNICFRENINSGDFVQAMDHLNGQPKCILCGMKEGKHTFREIKERFYVKSKLGIIQMFKPDILFREMKDLT